METSTRKASTSRLMSYGTIKKSCMGEPLVKDAILQLHQQDALHRLVDTINGQVS